MRSTKLVAMHGWGPAILSLAISVFTVIVFVAGRSHVRRGRTSEHESHVYGFKRRAKLLSTIPSEDRLERKTVERDIFPAQVEEEEVARTRRRSKRVRRPDDERQRQHDLTAAEIDLRHQDLQRQHPTRYRYMEMDDDNERMEHHFVPDETVEQRISHAIVENHREEASFAAIDNPAEVERLIAEAHDLIRDLNQEFGNELNEPRVADRMFNTNVMAVLATARSSRKIDFRTMKMIAVMRSFGRAANGGRNELAKVMAVRTLLGTARLTVKELEALDTARRLFGDDFAEAAGYVDHLSRTEEIVAARKLGITSKETTHDQGERSPTIDIGGRSPDRPFGTRFF